MAETDNHDITHLLIEWSNGNQAVQAQLIESVYQELHKLASSYLRRERPDHTLQPTALVHEAYLILIDQKRVQWQNRTHFFGIAAQIMRRILVDYARSQKAAKRGGEHLTVALEEAFGVAHPTKNVDLLALDTALQQLETFDPQQAQIVELRYFAGLKTDETAEVLGISLATVGREWSMAKAWLYRELSAGN